MADGVLITGFPGFIASRLVERLVTDEPETRLFLMCEPRFALTAKARCEALEQRLPAMKGMWHIVPGDIRRPGIKLMARNQIPRLAFPLTKIHFNQPAIKHRCSIKQLSQRPTTQQGATPHRQPGRQNLSQLLCHF